MILSQSCKIAIRAVLYLSLYSNEEKMFGPKEIAKAIDVPAPFLAKTFQELTKRDLVSSVRGRKGGYYLTEINKLNPILSIVESIDGMARIEECVLGLSECGDNAPCSIHHIIAPMKEAFLRELSTKTIEDLAKEVKNGKTHIVL